MEDDIEPIVFRPSIAIAVESDQPFVRDKWVAGIEDLIKGIVHFPAQAWNSDGQGTPDQVRSLNHGLIGRICEFNDEIATAKDDNGDGRLSKDLLQALPASRELPLHELALGDVAGRAGDRFDRSSQRKDRGQDVLVSSRFAAGQCEWRVIS